MHTVEETIIIKKVNTSKKHGTFSTACFDYHNTKRLSIDYHGRGRNVKVLFWNLGKNDNRKTVCSLIKENNVDIAIFAEYHKTDIDGVCQDLERQYTVRDGFGGCEKIRMIARIPIVVSVSREDTRYILYTIGYAGNQMIIAGIHLPANPGADQEMRKNVIRQIVYDIHELERKEGCKNTIVIGDFNANPFDQELIQKDCFNAVLFKEVIMRNETITHMGTRYQRFYNPIISYISEDPKSYGSFYHTGGSYPLYWYCLDQVIMRKSLIEAFVNMEYIKNVSGKSLTTNAGIRRSISDHLPLLAEFK